MLRGIAYAYLLQVQALQLDSKHLLSQLNGEYAWNVMKKQLAAQAGQGNNKKKRKADGLPNLSRPPMRSLTLDTQQLLDFTKEQMAFLTSAANSEC